VVLSIQSGNEMPDHAVGNIIVTEWFLIPLSLTGCINSIVPWPVGLYFQKQSLHVNLQ
jgi:hypothetical protein